ncbi:MAG: hypothetical protein CMB56_002070 [Methanobacteriota archaeon]|nr:MAG: hypothetical protein CMB56_002070 [Euryarchaeota archaeon]
MEKNTSSATKKEIERFHAWLATEDPLCIATHLYVDADAVFSAALLSVLKPDAQVLFVSADSEIEDARTLAVDLSNGKQSIKGLDVGSAFGLLVIGMKSIDKPLYRALRRWAHQLNLTDSGDGCRDAVVLAELVKAWRSLGLGDEGCFKRAKELVAGKIKTERFDTKQKQLAKSVKITNGIAVISNGSKVRAAHIFNQGAEILVRESEVGHSIMISKKLMKKGVKLTELTPLLEKKDWFVHPAGFIACHGSVKSPRDFRESGFNLQEIVRFVTTWLLSHVNSGLIKIHER